MEDNIDMIDMIERAAEMVGGVYKLSTLLQKRVRQLVRGAEPLVETSGKPGPIDIALQEVLENKISLVSNPVSSIFSKEELVQSEKSRDEKSPKIPEEKIQTSSKRKEVRRKWKH